MKTFLILFVALLPALVFAQTGNLPTIKNPKDWDRLETKTRWFPAAFRLDTLKSYFIAEANDSLAFHRVDIDANAGAINALEGENDGVVTSGLVTGSTSKILSLTRSAPLSVLEVGFTDLVNDADSDPANEIQTFDVSALIGTDLNLSLSSDGEATKTIDLSSLQDGTGTDDQDLSISGRNLTIEGGNTIPLPADANTQLTESQVDDFADNNGYLKNGDHLDLDEGNLKTDVSVVITSKVDMLKIYHSDVDVTDGYFKIGSSTGNAGKMIPLLDMKRNTSQSGFGATIVAESKINDNVPSLIISGRTEGGVTTNPLLRINNYTTPRFQINANGHIGVLTTPTSYELDVNGSVNVSDDIDVGGIVEANEFIGDGSGLTDVNAFKLDGEEGDYYTQTLDVSTLVGTDLNLSLSSDGEATKEIDLSSLQDGNGVEDGGTVSIPAGTQIQGYTWPSSAAFDNRTFYGDFVNGSYRNDRYTKGANGLGYEREVRFDASGNLVGVPHISISDASYSAGYLKGDRLFFDTPTSDWDLVFDVTHPTISSGAGKDYEVFMDARPTVNKSVLTTDTDGATEWNKYLQTYTVVLSSNEDITSTTFAEVSNLSITGIQAGIYQVHYSLIWQDKTSPSFSGGTPDFSYKINTTNESGDGSGWNSAGFTESVKDWDDVTGLNDNSDVGGTVSTNMNDGVVIFTNTGAFKYSHKNEVSGTIEMKKGSYIKLTKLD
jgi:hypothetical protein